MARKSQQLIPDSATLQVGLGQAPAAALEALHQHRDLGLHSGIFFDSFIRLIDAGAMDEQKPMLSGLAAGSDRFYERLKSLDRLQFTHVGETHNVTTMLGIPRYFTINSAIEVDLEGNVNAQFLGGKRISGPGGLPDYTAAGHGSIDGASIIVLPSTSSNGKHTRIVRRVEHMTVPGTQIDYVVTENGIARLAGSDTRQRASQIKAIANDAFVDHLE